MIGIAAGCRPWARWLLASVLLTSCGGATPSLAVQSCGPGESLDSGVCKAYATRTVERMPTPFVEGGRSVTLELVIYKPLRAGPHPTVIFHHGSTGNGTDPSLFRQTYTSESLAKFFVDQGWMVLFPQRRGRGASDGLYDEGFEPDRSRYSCRAPLALAGLDHALEDADAILQHVRGRSDVDAARVLVAGQSRGGILAVAHGARRREAYRGALNFVGGWLGEGCVDAVPVNRDTYVAAARTSPTSLWLYGENDSFYSSPHTRANFDAFAAAGGLGSYRLYRRSNANNNGHFLINEPALWDADVRAWLTQAVR